MTSFRLASSHASYLQREDRVRLRRQQNRRRVIASTFVLLALAIVAVLLGRAVLMSAVDGRAAPGEVSYPLSGGGDGLPGVSDGVIPDGDPASPFDESIPAIANLSLDLRAAVQLAAGDAEDDGYPFWITSGWRSQNYQDWLYNDAVSRYGSEAAAAEVVAAGSSSKHLSGDAVDIGNADTLDWMHQHGIDYGLCQTYANENWHFELATTPGGVCPEAFTDAANRP